MRRKIFGIMFAALAIFVGSVVNADDEKIANHLYKKLSEAKQQGSLKDFTLDMEVKDGIVYFSGRVASKTQKSMVLTMAQKAQDLGVLEIRDGISVAAKPAADSKPKRETKPEQPTEKATKPEPAEEKEPSKDEQIAKHLHKQLLDAKQQGSLKDFTLDMEVKEGIVYFRGKVASETQKGLVLTMAQKAQDLGVLEIRDDISVAAKPAPVEKATEVTKIAAKPEEETKPSQDDQIAKHLHEQLVDAKQQGSLKDFTLDMEVKEGIVHLRGQVASKTQKSLVLDIAKKSQNLGVLEIRDDISVTAKPAPKPTPVEPATDVTKIAAKPETQPKPAQVAVKAVKTQPKPTQVAVTKSSRVRHQAEAKPTQSLDYLGDGGAKVARAEQVASSSPRVRQASATQSAQTGKPAKETRPAQYTQPVQDIDYVSNATPNVAPPQQVIAAPAPARQVALMAARAPAPRAPLAMQGQQALQAPAYMPASAAHGARYDSPGLPNYAWPSYAPHPNYGAVTYPKTYSPTAWPYIGPFYPYPQVPLGWRKVTLEWDDGWWYLDFQDR